MEEYLNKIICGDCIDVMKKLPDNSVDCVVTSPPYNKGTSGKKQRNDHDAWVKGNITYDTYEDNMDENEYQKWQKSVVSECLRVLRPEGSLFYNHKPRISNHRVILPTEWLGGFNIKQLIIWDRGSSPIVDPIRFMPSTEHIYWITKNRAKPKFNKDSFILKEVWRINAKPEPNHPAPFPVQIPRICIEATTNTGDVVLDPFNGSGTTSLVAKQLKRQYIGIDLSEEYCKLAEQRLKNLQQTLI